jgi:cell wall-associated NlpC family hydrolase
VASRLSRRIRPVVAAVAASAFAALLIPAVALATPGQPAAPPTVDSVQKLLGDLAVQNSQLVEQYDQAQVDVAAKEKAADTAHQSALRSQAEFTQARRELSQTVAAQYEGGSFSATGALLSSSDGTSYLDQLSTLNMMSAHTQQILMRATDAKQVARQAQQRSASLLAGATAKRNDVAQKKDIAQKQIDKYKTMLATLTAAQHAAFERAINPTVSPAVVKSVTAASVTAALPVAHGLTGQAAKAVQFALAQVGKPYVFGASGPGSYDCSGLTMASWASAGVALPHSALNQYNYGTHVALSQLVPGDLVFFYQPIGHVSMYIGNGMVVSAPQPGENVSVVPLRFGDSSITGATRLP